MTDLPETLDLLSHHIADDKKQELLRLFPEIRTEDGKIDFDQLKLVLGGMVDTGKERYGMNWPGKADCFKIIQTPSLGTLLPCPEESVNFDTTENLIIEGDNLEVLKLLQKSYLGKIKMIYIDPPYNTGNDFIYPDNYTESLQTYLEYTGQVDTEGRKFGTNSDTEGRFHSRWLNMMYPRLYLARDLLQEDGSIFISIDEKELFNLRNICNDIFGEECFVAVITVLCNPKGRSQDKHFATNHEYVVVYTKNPLPKGSFSVAKDEEQIEDEYPEEDDGGKYRLLELRNTHREFGRHNRKNLFYPFYVNNDGDVCLENDNGYEEVFPIWDDGFEGCWTWDRNKSEKDGAFLVAKMVKDRWKIYRKSYANGVDRMLKTIFLDKLYYTERGQKEFNQLFGTKGKLFQSPKSPYLISSLLQTATKGNDLVLDFFAGSGTMAQAIMMTNSSNYSELRYILVQLPEPLDPHNSDQKLAADYCDKLGKPRNLAEIMKERVRRAANKINGETPGYCGDLGFGVYKLAESNFKTWETQAPQDRKAFEHQLKLHIKHIRDDRIDIDILSEILLKSGFPLTTPVERLQVLATYNVFRVAEGALLVCLERELTTELIRALAEMHPERVVCLDAGFAGNDQLKANAVQIFKTKGVPSFKTI